MNERKEQIADTLRESREELLAAVAGLKDADWQRETPCEGWTVKDVIGHVGVGEPGNIIMVRRILSDEEGAVPGFDLDRYNRRQVEKRRDKSTSELLDDLSTARESTLAFFGDLSDEQLDKRGHRTTGEETTVEQIFYRIAGHEREHTEHILQALR